MISGVERYLPELQHMQERILVLRDQVIGKDDPGTSELMRRVELSNESCGTSTDRITHEILIGEVEIISMLMPSVASV